MIQHHENCILFEIELFNYLFLIPDILIFQVSDREVCIIQVDQGLRFPGSEYVRKTIMNKAVQGTCLFLFAFSRFCFGICFILSFLVL